LVNVRLAEKNFIHEGYGAKESAFEPDEKQQVPPLRCAPVGMTILWDH